jgi:hypothetical protein
MAFPFKTTYVQERGPAVPSFDEYAARIMTEFAALLESDPLESQVQQFLEQNPSMVPGAWTPGSPSGHGPFYEALIRQPKLHGFDCRVPDFMWLSTHSTAWFPAMIEIERPGKKLFTVRGVPTAHFSQARNQFAQWKAWLDVPANVQLLMDEYGIPADLRSMRAMELHFILIFGRRSETKDQPKLMKLRSRLLSPPEELMSFDRLTPNKNLSEAITVEATGSGRFRVVAVPETFAVSPYNASNLLVFGT